MFRCPALLSIRSLFRRFHARRHSVAGADSTPIGGPLKVDHVDDPDSSMRLIRAAGVIGPESIESLNAHWQHVTAPFAIHLDLFDAQITDPSTSRRLESALDHLERQQIAVRVVGLDPSHPAIAS